MRTENMNVKLTIPIPIEKPDKNGNVYTKEAIENAVNNLHTNLPIIYKDNENENEDKVIGITTGTSHIVTWDSENQVCKVTIDGVVFYGGTECIVSKIKEGKVADFRITSIGLSK